MFLSAMSVVFWMRDGRRKKKWMVWTLCGVQHLSLVPSMNTRTQNHETPEADSPCFPYRFQRTLIQFWSRVWITSWFGVIRYHGVFPVRKLNQVISPPVSPSLDSCVSVFSCIPVSCALSACMACFVLNFVVYWLCVVMLLLFFVHPSHAAKVYVWHYLFSQHFLLMVVCHRPSC